MLALMEYYGIKVEKNTASALKKIKGTYELNQNSPELIH
jgi:hypothetical protein